MLSSAAKPFLALTLLALAHPLHAGELRGRVLAGEKPTAGVIVTAVPYETPLALARRQARKTAAPAPLASATTAANGSFTLVVPHDRAKAETDFRVRFEGVGVAATVLDGIYGSGETEELGDQTIARGEKLAGRVVDAAGAPVPDAEVTLLAGRDRLEDAGVSRAAVLATTGADGSFRIEGATTTGNAVGVFKEGFAPMRQTGLRAGGVSHPFVLRKGSTISGTVRESDRKTPGKGTLVRFESLTDTRWVEVGEDGAFSLREVPEGTRGRVVAESEAGATELGGLTLPLALERKLNLVLTGPASIEGRIVDAKTGRALPRTKVRLRAGTSLLFIRSEADGRYRLRPLAAGRYALRVDDARYVPYEKPELALTPGETRKLDIALTLGSTIAGRVTDENGAPVAGAKGRLARGGETGMAAMMRQMRSGDPVAFRTGPDGTFRAARLAPGDNQRLTVGHPEFESATLAGLALPAGGVKANVGVLLRRGLVLTGHVRDGDGNPLAGADVELGGGMPTFRGGRGGMRAAVNLGGRGSAERPHETSGPDGRFLVRGVSLGDYFLNVKKAGFGTERVDVKVGEEAPAPIVVTLSPGASISGFVKAKSGIGVEGYLVSPSPPGRGAGGAMRMMGAGDQEPTGQDGAFLIEGLKAGQAYDLQLFGGGGPGPQKRGVLAPADNVEILVNGTGQISGVALDARTGRPITDYNVSYEPDRGGGMGMMVRMVNRGAGRRMSGIGERETVHQEDGKFLLPNVPAGTWTVIVESKGYQTARVGSIVVAEGVTKENVEIKATAGGTLKGRVSDGRSGRAVPEAAITSETGEGGGLGGLMRIGGGESEVTTDADGRFEIEGLAVGKLRVTARHADYSETTESVELREGGANVDLHLSKGSTIGGTVFSDGRQGVAGVDVNLAPAGESGFGRMGFGAGAQATQTDATGRFHFEHLNAGRYSVTASLRSATSAPADVVVQEGDSKEDVALTLAAGATIRGTVSGLPDEQRSGVNVSATGPESYFGSSRTGADGRFELTGVPAGSIQLRAQAGDMLGATRTATRQVTTAEGASVVETEIVFEPGFVLSGRVSKAGSPVADGTVFAGQQGSGRSASARTDEGGSYRLEGLAPGTYNVTAMSGAFGRSARNESVTLASDQTLDLNFPSARLAGNVVESGSRQPLADATVEFSSAAGSSAGPFMRAFTTDSNGHFSVEDLENKSYTLNVRKNDYLFEKREVVAAENGTDQLTIELTRGEGIGVQARDGIYNIPLRGLLVRVLDAQKSAVFTGSIVLDSQGRGDIPSLKPGRYTVMADASGYAPVTIDGVSVPSQTVPVTLTAGGNVEIRSGPKTLAGGTGTQARFLTASGVSYAYSLFAADGQVALASPVRRLENFAAGSYILALTGGDSKPFSVREGGSTLIELP
ncbi:MAG: carboxypeptidase regulatory-like domain-containing protein [Thermoanaerobaculia bacterium]